MIFTVINLIRNNKIIDSIDFYGFLQKGLLDKNVRLQDQDVIRFRPVTKRIIFSGEVVRPAIYELLENETLATAIGFTGGFKPAAIKDVAKLARYDVRTMSLKDVAAADFETMLNFFGSGAYKDKSYEDFKKDFKPTATAKIRASTPQAPAGGGH